MAYEQMLAPVLEKQALAKNIYRMVLQCRSIAQQAVPGQFVHLLPAGYTLRRPISICEINQTAGTLTIVFEVKGSGTDALANVRVGENLDILGPLGRGFTILPDAKHIVAVGGGIGNPPMLSLAQVYGNRATAICGFRSAGIVTLQDEFHASGAETILCTDDGTVGRHALITEPLKVPAFFQADFRVCHQLAILGRNQRAAKSSYRPPQHNLLRHIAEAALCGRFAAY